MQVSQKTMLSPTYQPSRLSRKMPMSPLTSPINPTFRKEGDQDPWSDYLPEDVFQNNENMDPTNVSSNSQNTKNSGFQQPFLKGNGKKERGGFKPLSDCSNPIITISPEEQIPPKESRPITFSKAYKDYAQKLLEQQFNENSQISNQEDAGLIEGLLLGPSQIKQLEIEGEQLERSKMANFSKKLEVQKMKSLQKKEVLQQEVLRHQLKECTFTPTVHQVVGGTGNRDFSEFLEGQKNFQQKIEVKKQILKENQEKKFQEIAPLKPEINKTSKKILLKASSSSSSTNLAVFDRLYNNRFERPEKENLEISLGLLPEVPEINEANIKYQQPFTPTIHTKSKGLVRNEPIEEILYKDAKRRQEDFLKRKKQSSVSKESTQKVAKNTVSHKLIIQKFIKEFENEVIRVLKISTESQESNFLLDYLQIGEVLRVLGFISLKEPQDAQNLGNLPQERMLLADLWTILKGEELGGVSKRNLCMFLLSIQGLYWCDSENAARENNSNQLGFFNEKNEWEVDEAGSRWIHSTYELFYRTRLASESLKKLKTSEDQGKFQPEISETSKVLAEHYRERLLEEFAQIMNTQNVPEIKLPENGALTHTDLLVLQKKTQKLQHEKKGKEKIQDELKSCPFKPQINKKKSKTLVNKGPRHLELYEMGKNKFSRVDRDPKEIEFEKNYEECTFKPDISQGVSVRSVKSSNKDYFAKDIDKTIERMRNARKERELVKLWTERGIPLKNCDSTANSNIKQCPMSSSRITRLDEEGLREDVNNAHQQDSPINEGATNEEIENSIENRIPLLYVDVNLGASRTERIVVFEGDESEELAERFVQEHGLDANMKFKLKDLLDAQIAGVLTRIEEERASLNSDSEFNHQMK